MGDQMVDVVLPMVRLEMVAIGLEHALLGLELSQEVDVGLSSLEQGL